MLKSVALITLITSIFSLSKDHDRCLVMNLMHQIQQFEKWDCGICDKVQKPQFFEQIPEDNTKINLAIGFYANQAFLSFNFRELFVQTFPYAAVKSPVSYSQSEYQILVQDFFLKTWNSIKSQTRNFLEQVALKKGIDTLFVTGNSIGGAIATIGARQINQWNIFNSFEVVTFSPMMVGNDKWADNFNEQLGNKYTHYDFDYCMANNYPIYHPDSIREDIQFFHVGRQFDCNMAQNVCFEVKQSLQRAKVASYVKRNLRSVNNAQILSPNAYSATNINVYSYLVINASPVTYQKSYIVPE